jgi:hypothetical protein
LVLSLFSKLPLGSFAAALENVIEKLKAEEARHAEVIGTIYADIAMIKEGLNKVRVLQRISAANF